MRGATIQADRFDALAIGDGMIEITGLKAGDYDLWLKETGERIRIRVADGPLQAGYVLGKLRHLQLPALKPVQIAGIASDADTVTIRLRDFSNFTRLHVYAHPLHAGVLRLRRPRQSARRRTCKAVSRSRRNRSIWPAATSAMNTATCSIAACRRNSPATCWTARPCC